MWKKCSKTFVTSLDCFGLLEHVLRAEFLYLLHDIANCFCGWLLILFPPSLPEQSNGVMEIGCVQIAIIIIMHLDRSAIGWFLNGFVLPHIESWLLWISSSWSVIILCPSKLFAFQFLYEVNLREIWLYITNVISQHCLVRGVVVTMHNFSV